MPASRRRAAVSRTSNEPSRRRFATKSPSLTKTSVMRDAPVGAGVVVINEGCHHLGQEIGRRGQPQREDPRQLPFIEVDLQGTATEGQRMVLGQRGEGRRRDVPGEREELERLHQEPCQPLRGEGPHVLDVEPRYVALRALPSSGLVQDERDLQDKGPLVVGARDVPGEHAHANRPPPNRAPVLRQLRDQALERLRADALDDLPVVQPRGMGGDEVVARPPAGHQRGRRRELVQPRTQGFIWPHRARRRASTRRTGSSAEGGTPSRTARRAPRRPENPTLRRARSPDTRWSSRPGSLPDCNES